MAYVIKKVWAYVIRGHANDIELLIFEHVDLDAGIQIPAGTVEANEDPRIAVERELLEESGIRVESFAPLGIIEREWDGQAVMAHLFATWAPPHVAEEWIHNVTGSGEDARMQFRYFWLRRGEWHKVWGDFKLGYPALDRFVANAMTEKS